MSTVSSTKKNTEGSETILVRNAEDINDVSAEAGVIATLIHHPDYYFHAEELLPAHCSNLENRAMYTALQKIAENGVDHVDAYNIIEFLGSSPATQAALSWLTVDQVQELISNSNEIARSSVEEYRVLVSNILSAAFRRDAWIKLGECQKLCTDPSEENLEQKIYDIIDDISTTYSVRTEIPTYAEVVDDHWREIESRQGNGYAGIPFKFRILNEYVTMERGELVIFAAEPKQGKSMLLLNCAVDLLKQDKSVLYLDSELNTRMFTARLLSHLSGIEYKRLTAGIYSEEEHQRILEAKEWMKTRRFTHIYIPIFDVQSVYTAVKKVSHMQDGLDVIVVDYFKSSGDGDAFLTYSELGKFVDTVKNRICGDMGIAGIGAAQATSTGKLADSAKIARNASTICMIQDKTPEEIEADGEECGNKKLRVVFNRNGMQMASGEYIDLRFDGNHILYEEAKQHIPQTPF